jgi:hypothetical protein
VRTPKNTSGLSSIALREEQYEEFKQACDSAGVSQAEAIQRLMREFIENQKQK